MQQLSNAGDLVAVTLAIERPGSDWCGIQRGTVLGPTTGGDRRVAMEARTSVAHATDLRCKSLNFSSRW